MKKLTIRHVIMLFLLVTLSLLHFAPAGAQAVNLLSNPGFESPYVSAGGEPVRQVAQGWTPWHLPRTADMPTYQNTQPEYAPAAPDTSRIRSGSNAQLYFSFFATHQGGVFQRVTGITAGAELRFSVYAYIWSTTFDDRAKSEEDGDVIVQVGIDPTGGTDPTSGAIVWSTAIEQYDAYREYAVIARATGTAVTVFVRSIVGFPVQHSYIYLDDAVLAPTTQTPPAATNTPVPTNTVQPTVLPTNTFVPTNTSAPTTVVVVPTNTVPPSVTPEPSATPSDPTPTIQVALPTATEIAAVSPTQPAVGGPVTPITQTFPGTIIHTVRRGDNVASLAVLYNSTIEAILQANGLDSNALIYVGQGLVIPVRLPPPATSTPSPTPIVIIVTATPGGVPATGGADLDGSAVYIVQAGDTLSRIAARFNTTVAALAQLNGIVNPNRIQVGQRLVVTATGGPVAVPTSPAPVVVTPTSVPAPVVRTYVVFPGDNLFRISLRFNVSMQRLIQANGIINPNQIYAGQVLIIP